jgi:kynurenine 3-monooxygenase
MASERNLAEGAITTNLEPKQRIVICGAGLCGTLTALILADMGYKVRVFESRERAGLFADSGRSFNITLTERGMKALRILGLEDTVIQAGVKCFGRQVRTNGGSFCTPYGTGGKTSRDFLLSISRITLNKILLVKMQDEKRIHILFGHTCTDADLKGGNLSFLDRSSLAKLEVEADVIIGTDGVWSVIRQNMMRQSTVEFSQRFAHQQYKELYTPPGVEGAFVYGGDEKEGALHLWPRKDFMLLAMPNKDHSFSTTLFAPEAIFRSLEAAGPAGVRAFFDEHFQEASPYMPTLEEDFATNPVGKLVETRCLPYHFTPLSKPSPNSPVGGEPAEVDGGSTEASVTKSVTTMKTVTTVLMGDAAHAMYPFMGQGTNAAFEDVLVLRALLQEHGTSTHVEWPKVAAAFTEARKPQLDALADMAAEHDKTLCTMAFSPVRVLRTAFAKIGGESFRPLYSAVAFSAEPYGSCIALEKSRLRMLQQVVTLGSYMFVAAAAAAATVVAVGGGRSSRN